MVGGDDPLYLKYWVKLTPLAQKNADFQSIFARSASAATPSFSVLVCLCVCLPKTEQKLLFGN